MNKSLLIIPAALVAILLAGGIYHLLNRPIKDYDIKMDFDKSALIEINSKGNSSCIGNGTKVKDLIVRLKPTNIDYKNETAKSQLKEILNITAVKLSSTWSSIPLNCTLKKSSELICKGPLNQTYSSGKYYVKIPREKMINKKPDVVLKTYTSQNSLTVTKKNYHKFPYEKYEDTIFFKNNTNEYNFTFKFSEPILEKPKFILGGNVVECIINKEKNNTMICKINKEKYPPTEEGKVYEGEIINVCDDIECKVKIISKVDTIYGRFETFKPFILTAVYLLIGIIVMAIAIPKLSKKNKNNKIMPGIKKPATTNPPKEKINNPAKPVTKFIPQPSKKDDANKKPAPKKDEKNLHDREKMD